MKKRKKYALDKSLCCGLVQFVLCFFGLFFGRIQLASAYNLRASFLPSVSSCMSFSLAPVRHPSPPHCPLSFSSAFPGCVGGGGPRPCFEQEIYIAQGWFIMLFSCFCRRCTGYMAQVFYLLQVSKCGCKFRIALVGHGFFLAINRNKQIPE